MSFTKADVKAIIEMKGLDNLSAKSVRISLEERLGLEEGSLKSAKSEISEMIDAVLNEMPQGDEDDEEDDEEEEEAPPQKKAKKAAAATEENPNKGKSTCVTKTGEECPKNIKAMQGSMKMSAKKFLESGKSLDIDVDGNKLHGDPRSFSSGNMGWYLNGKVPIDVNGQTVWAQVGMNVTIPGSAAWKR